jgi:hypothetical protein
MDFAYKTTGTDKVIAFDGAVGGINVSRSLKDHLLEIAPEISDRVDNILMPKWLKQRGILVNA